MSPRAVLVGLPGAGKTSTGRRLAKILALPFTDSDELVEAEAGCPVAELFARAGEPAFRSAERRAILTALREFDGVLALGGGALGTSEIREAVQNSAVPVIFLQASLDTLAGRVGDARTRPLLAEGPAERLAALAAARSPVYEALASFAVETDGRTPSQVAATIAARLHDLEVRQ
jgi:shikimate kinase